MKHFANIHSSFVMVFMGILLFTITGCGVRGPLYLPPPPPQPVKPPTPEPRGVQYPAPSSSPSKTPLQP